MTENPSLQNTSTLTCKLDATRQTVVFLGAPFNASDRMLGVLAAEFATVDFIRVLSITDLAEMSRGGRHISMVSLEERDVLVFLKNPSPFFAAAGKAKIILAYRNLEVARTIVAASETDRRFASISFLPLDVHLEVWISIVRLLLLGMPYIPADLTLTSNHSTVPNTAAEHKEDPSPVPALDALTRREREVLELAATGLQNKNIAGKLALSEHTVKLHMHRVLSKLGLHNRTAATHWYLHQAPQIYLNSKEL